MKSREKILQILTSIKNESEINADPTTVQFDFNHHIIGVDFLDADEEMRILSKLQNEGWIILNLPNDDNKEITTSNTPEDYMADRDHVTLQVSPNFRSRYRLFKLLTFSSENKWNYVNPIWLLWNMFALILSLSGKLIHLILQHKLVSGVITILGLLTIDYVLACHNISLIWNLLKDLFNF